MQTQKVKKILIPGFFFLVFFSVSQGVSCQTPAGSFQCHIQSAQTLSVGEISTFLTKANFENYRLRNDKTTLVFDNGFQIILMSATEAQQQGLIANASNYQASFPKEFKMPVFHMSDNGKIVAGYDAIGKKHPTK